jgi:hypothetical protein
VKYRFFHIPTREADAETEALNRVLGQHRILSVERHLVADGQNSFWALSVVCADAESAPGTPDEAVRGRKPKQMAAGVLVGAADALRRLSGRPTDICLGPCLA